MWEEIQVLQLFPDPCASTQRYLTPAQIFGNPGVTFSFRDYFQEGLEDCSAASLFISNVSFGWPIHRINFGAV